MAAGVHVEPLDGDIDLRRNFLAPPGGQPDLVRGQQGSEVCRQDTLQASVKSLGPKHRWQILDFIGAVADGQRGVIEIGREFDLADAHGQSAGGHIGRLAAGKGVRR